MDAISLTGVTKSFKKHAVKREYTSFKTELIRWMTGKRRDEKPQFIEAIRGVDLIVPKGKTVGIVGRNGSGKSTLLKLITGIYTPTTGAVNVNGRISALLDLGAGFHPDFSGRENILINAMMLGMSRAEAIRRTPEIIAFSELGDFVDEPVRTYSSGMFMRLAFAVATHVDPEILIIDEILAVGDEHFSKKSKAKMQSFKASDKTILLVTHDLATLQSWCDSAVWLDGGRVRMSGDPHHVVDAYKQALAVAEAQQDAGAPSALNCPGVSLPELASTVTPEHGPKVGPPRRVGNFRAEISAVRLLNGEGERAGTIDPEASLELQIDYVTKDPLSDIGFDVAIRNASGDLIYGTSTFNEGIPLPSPLPPSGTMRLRIPRIGLTAGTYTFDVSLRTRRGLDYDSHRGLYGFNVQSPIDERGFVRIAHSWEHEPPADRAESAHG